MGIGDGLIPENLDQTVYDRVVTVTDQEAIAAARDLARLEGILCGITGGSNAAAALRMGGDHFARHRRTLLLHPTLFNPYPALTRLNGVQCLNLCLES